MDMKVDNANVWVEVERLRELSNEQIIQRTIEVALLPFMQNSDTATALKQIRSERGLIINHAKMKVNYSIENQKQKETNIEFSLL